MKDTKRHRHLKLPKIVKEKRNMIKFSKVKSLRARARNYLKKNNKKKVKKSLFLLRRKV